MSGQIEKLGRLEKVELNEIWAKEDADFTPWLAKEENLAILGKKLNMELELVGTEWKVGSFSADILCKDTEDNSKVLIENQFGKTDHKHLGQLLTYAAGVHANTDDVTIVMKMVWIAATIRDERRAALDWLNENTDDNLRFFGLEVEAFRIGDSLPAPNFNIVSKPNDWSRAAKAISSGKLSDTQELYLDYWTKLKDKLEDSGSNLKLQTPPPRSWLQVGIGNSRFGLIMNVWTKKKSIGVELYIYDDPKQICFNQLKQDKAEIEQIIDAQLDWKDLPNRKASRIMLIKDNADITDEDDRDRQFTWLMETLHKFDTAFRQRVKNIVPDDTDYADMPEDLEED